MAFLGKSDPSRRLAVIGGERAARASLRWVMALLLAPCFASEPQAPGPWQLKAAFLFNFTQYVQWPKEAFTSPDSPFVFGVFGKSPLGSTLDGFLAGERIESRPATVRYFTNLNDAASCHILYIAESHQPNVRPILARLKGRPVLTVSDIDGFTEAGGMIRFITGTRVRFRINPQAATEAGLTMNPKLLRLAEVIDTTSRR